MKKNQNRLLLMNFFNSLGTTVVGVFLPFLVAQAFNFSIWQLMIWVAGFFFAGFLFVFPLNKVLNRYFSLKGNLQFGLLFLALFYITISLAPNTLFWVILATCFFFLGIFSFWPSYHLLNLYSTQTAGRGDYIGKMQAITVGVNIITPLLSGFLLDQGLENWISLVAAVCFLLAIFSAQSLEVPNYKLANFAGIWSFFQSKFKSSSIFKITIIEGIQNSALWVIWPVFFKSILLGFTQMGWFVAFTALIEIISSKISGKLTDQKSAKKSLKTASVIRFLELFIRGLIFWFPTQIMAGLVSFFAGALGPIYNVSLYARSIEIIEKNQGQEFNFVIVHEILLSLVKMLIYILAFFITFYLGVKYLVILIFLAAVSSFALRKT